ncbi:Cyclin-dependent kinase F-1 [Nymphaea thermarum]|nr:Cyclin-dependent kinase F-1 [Nymphaea thermarum]
MANSRSWSIYGNSEIAQRYEILERVGYGAYADVYRAKRRDDGLPVALKEVHDYQSAYREIEALQLLQSSSPNVVTLHEFFWNDDDDVVLVLEYLPTDLATVIDEAKRRVGEGGEGIPVGEIKRWMLQIFEGVAACHGNWVVHRDLKPANLLISADGVLKLADFGQSWILQQPGFLPGDDNPNWAEGQDTGEQAMMPQRNIGSAEENRSQEQASVGWLNNVHDPVTFSEPNQDNCEDGLHKTDNLVNMQDTGSSFISSVAGDYSNNLLHSPCHDSENDMGENEQGLTSCVGTRWYRAPELLYGSTNYGLEIDLWSVGCIFSELLALEPLFQGTADIDQLAKIINVLGNINEQTWPGCSSLPDYGKISFKDIQVPLGLKACLPNRSQSEVSLVERLVRYDPMARATALELMDDNYFNEEPLAVPVSKLKVPSTRSTQENSANDWDDQAWKNLGADSDFEDFGGMDFAQTDKGFSIRFS